MNKKLLLLTSLLLLAAFLFGRQYWQSKKIRSIRSFEECGALYPIMESYPPRCATPDGRSFTQDIGNELDKIDKIQAENPRPNQMITSPLTIVGQARGMWFFEASFPIKLLDSNNNVIATGIAQAQGEWMTENFVPFTATLQFAPQTIGSAGTLILQKDNPSGDPQRDESLRIPIRFQ